MSLRPDDERNGRFVRSRSRTRERSRSRDARGASPNPKAPSSSTSKDNRKPGIASKPGDDTKSRSAPAEPALAPRYEERKPSTVAPGLSSLSSSRPTFAADEDDSDDDSEVGPEEPSYAAKEPSFGTAVPSYEAAEPSYRAEDPPYRAAEPSYGATEPSYRAEEPFYGASESSYRAVEPPYRGTEPPYRAAQPSADFRSIRGLEMPYFPSDAEPESSPRAEPSSRNPRTSLPYPAYGSGMYPDDENDSYMPMPAADYAVTEAYKYAPQPEKVSYSARPLYAQPTVPHTEHPQRQFSTSSIPTAHSLEIQHRASPVRSSSYSSYTPLARDIKPQETKSSKGSADSKGKPSRLSTAQPQTEVREPSSALAPRMDYLSVSGNRPDVSGNGIPPPSPLLEAYHGTYQSMPSPLMLPSDGGLDDVPPLSPDETNASSSRKVAIAEPKSQKKRVTIYDAEVDADALASALNRNPAQTGPLIDILPNLTHDRLLKLRDEYKKRVKVQNRGVNISKHIKMKTDGHFGKACYVTSLGRWESEAYWANFWYHAHASSRELLIEALMGRTNAEIREIKDCFRDKRYDDNLSRCMEKELKPDKFRTAVLMALEAKRQEETDPWPPENRAQDVERLRNALKSREGGETAILQIVIRRSDTQLREVLRMYENVHQANFAREALRKSNNLVGEVIAHILNGCINRPSRDSLLLRHAIEDITARNRAVELRYELLMSRLIRLHWDSPHLAKVKDEYKKKYGNEIEMDITQATKADFREFCLKLCESA